MTFLTVRRCLNFQRKFYTTTASQRDTKDKKWNVLFFGSDNFSLKSLELIYNDYKVRNTVNRLEVVSSINRSNAVTKFASKQNLNIHPWPIAELSKNKFHLGVVVSFGHLIPRRLIEAFPLGIINVHASLLPRWRGAAPIIHSLLQGDEQTGVSIMRIQPHHFDVGDVIAQRKVDISRTMLQPELYETLATLGAETLLECLSNLPECLDTAQRQDSQYATYAPKISQELSKIDWGKSTAEQVHNLSRALYGIYPLVTQFKKHHLKLQKLQMWDDTSGNIQSLPPGHFEFSKKRKAIRVFCADEKCVYLESLTISGKREMSAADFRNGFMKNVPSNELFFTNIQ